MRYCTPYRYISAVKPRIMMADWKDTNIDIDVGKMPNFRLAMMNSWMVFCLPPVTE
jgi:hypothetical protein